jgi:peptide/nickel transport system ATP-binding protein
MGENGSLVRLEDVKMYFRVRRSLFRSIPVKAVDGVTLTIRRGETLGLVGESGSGKTTLGRVSLRLLTPTGGRVIYDGRDITRAREQELRWMRRRAQIIFQDPYSAIDPFMSIYQVLEEPLVLHQVGDRAEREELIHRALEDVKLTPTDEFAAKYPHMLSGGQRQRVGIARALILQPDYIVADEPVSMIDASSRTEILLLLRELQAKYGIAFLYITHDVATVKYFSDRIGVMYLGRIVELGPTRKVIANPLHPYTQALIEAVPDPDPQNRFRERKVIPGEPPNPINVPSGCSFHPRCPQFMAGKCEVLEPRLVEVEPNHYVACHLYPEA